MLNTSEFKRNSTLSKKPVKAKKAKASKRKVAKKAVVGKKPAAKKKAAAKTIAKKSVKKLAKKSPSKTAVKKKPASKKLIAKKSTIKKSQPKKAVKKAAPRKAAPKVAAKKTAPRKAAVKKITPRKALAIKIAAKPVYHFEGPAAPQVKLILAVLDDAKAENTIAINIAGRSAMADAMVITTGRVNRHVNAIADQLLFKLKSSGIKNVRVEGKEAGDWCLVDTGDVIIHIFRPEVRSFYNLEKLWSADAPKENA